MTEIDRDDIIHQLFGAEMTCSPTGAYARRQATFRTYAEAVNNRTMLAMMADDEYEIAEANHHCDGNWVEHVAARRAGILP